MRRHQYRNSSRRSPTGAETPSRIREVSWFHWSSTSALLPCSFETFWPAPDSAIAMPFVGALHHVPRHENDFVRERATWVLSRVTKGRLAEPLRAALDDHDWRVAGLRRVGLGSCAGSAYRFPSSIADHTSRVAASCDGRLRAGGLARSSSRYADAIIA
jgi:hypothetical protein